MPSPTTLELRCYCRRKPLLGMCGRDANGKPFVHVRAYRQQRIYAEVVATEGEVRIRCRECFRWYVVTIKHGAVDFTADQLPAEITL